MIKLIIVVMIAFFSDSPGAPLSFHEDVEPMPGMTLQWCEEHKAEVAAKIIPSDAAVQSVEGHEVTLYPKDSA